MHSLFTSAFVLGAGLVVSMIVMIILTAIIFGTFRSRKH